VKAVGGEGEQGAVGRRGDLQRGHWIEVVVGIVGKNAGGGVGKDGILRNFIRIVVGHWSHRADIERIV